MKIDKNEILRKWDDGASIRSLSKETGVHPITIRNILTINERHADRRPPRKIAIHTPLWQIKQACRVTVPQLAFLIKQSQKTVDDWIYKAKQPKAVTLFSIAGILRIAPCHLIDNTYEVTPEQIMYIRGLLGRNMPAPIPEPVETLSLEDADELDNKIKKKVMS